MYFFLRPVREVRSFWQLILPGRKVPSSSSLPTAASGKRPYQRSSATPLPVLVPGSVSCLYDTPGSRALSMSGMNKISILCNFAISMQHIIV